MSVLSIKFLGGESTLSGIYACGVPTGLTHARRLLPLLHPFAYFKAIFIYSPFTIYVVSIYQPSGCVVLK